MAGHYNNNKNWISTKSLESLFIYSNKWLRGFPHNIWAILAKINFYYVVHELLRQLTSCCICSILTEIECIAFQFAISLGVIFILEIAAGAYAYSKRKEVSWTFCRHDPYQSYGSFSLCKKIIFCLNECKLRITNCLTNDMLEKITWFWLAEKGA